MPRQSNAYLEPETEGLGYFESRFAPGCSLRQRSCWMDLRRVRPDWRCRTGYVPFDLLLSRISRTLKILRPPSKRLSDLPYSLRFGNCKSQRCVEHTPRHCPL